MFDNMANESVGAIAIAPSDPDIVYVGKGEANNRQSSSIGDGVWGTTDGGKTWNHLGLEDTQSIARIVVDPTDPTLSMSRRWGTSSDRMRSAASIRLRMAARRGRNRSSSTISPALRTWRSIPSIRILFAASYNRLRTWWGYNGGGPGSGLWKIHGWRRHLEAHRRAELAEAKGRTLRPHCPLHFQREALDDLCAGGVGASGGTGSGTGADGGAARGGRGGAAGVGSRGIGRARRCRASAARRQPVARRGGSGGGGGGAADAVVLPRPRIRRRAACTAPKTAARPGS